MGFGLSFGKSKGKSSSKTSSTSTSQTGLPKDVIDAIKGDANGIYQKLQKQGYTPKEIEGMNEDQLAALQKLNQSGHLESVLDQTQGGIDRLWDNIGGLEQMGEGAFDQTTGKLTQGALDLVNSDILKNQTDAIDQSAQSSVDQANRLIQRNLQENTMPSIYRQGVGEGNVGSSRSAIAQGVAARGAMEQSSNVAQNIMNQANQQKADLTSQMYQQGLGISQNMSQQNVQNRLQGLLGSISGGTSALGQLDRISGAGQQSILNQLLSGNLQQQQGQKELDNDYMNQVGQQLKEAGVTDINTIMDILNKMNPLMDKTTTGSGKTSGTTSNTSMGATGSFK